jgi:hypothetical protein
MNYYMTLAVGSGEYALMWDPALLCEMGIGNLKA